MAKREVILESGSQVQLTSLRTRRKVHCTTSELVGLGGMAKVYGGELDDGTQVVLKTQRFEGRGADHLLEVEIELFKKLFHRNIVHCVGVGVSPAGHLIIGFRRAYPNPLLLMTNAAVDQGMRRDKKARYPCLPLDTAIDLGYELLNALAYLERLGFVHHDVKLANLLIDVAPKERPLEGNEIFGRVVRRAYRGVLIDFGATRSRNYLDAWNRGEASEGLAPQITPFYAPPESVVETRNERGDLKLSFDPSLDVYAAALLLHTTITGHPPYSHLREPPDAHDLETVISAKSAERRGEIVPISRETMRRVVFEDTKFLHGDRASFDTAFNRFLLKRLDPDPDKRGTAAEMKRDFERVMRIRSSRDFGEAQRGASRVFLPFQQELVQVGKSGEHPLLRAARLYGLEAKRDQESGRIEIPTNLKKGGGPEALDPSRRDGLDWLEEMDATAGEAEGTAAAPPPAGDAGPAPAPRRGTPPPRRPAPRVTRRHAAVSPGELAGEPTQPRRPPARRPSDEAPVPQPQARGRKKPPSTTDRIKREELLRRAGRGGRRRRRQRPPPQNVNVTQTRSTTQSPPDRSSGKNPVGRGYPPEPLVKAPHCLLSPVLDTPLLLSREQRHMIGREPSVDVRIKSDLVSRRHAEIHWDGKGFVLTDLGSLNGTTLNGFRVQSPCVLHDEDRIGFGGFEFVVRVLSGGEWSVDEEGGSTRIFRGSVDWTTSHTPAFAGDLSRLAIRDVIEIIDWKRHSGTLTLNLGDEKLGEIFFDGGKLIHAQANNARGVEAAVRLLSSRRGRFAFQHGKPSCPTTVEAELDDIWEKVKGVGG